eukprot:7019-Heterococcus_DN1.PRE.11
MSHADSYTALAETSTATDTELLAIRIVAASSVVAQQHRCTVHCESMPELTLLKFCAQTSKAPAGVLERQEEGVHARPVYRCVGRGSAQQQQR